VSNSFYISNGGDALGPYEIGQLRSMWNAGQIAADFLYWKTDIEEWRSITELGFAEAAAPPEQSPPTREGLIRKFGGATKRETPVRYWMWRLGSIGLFIGFLVGLKQAASLDLISAVSYSFGASLPYFLLFAAIGAVVGYVAKWRQKSNTR
jgi:hypothetical protein